jgi:hypothetical protein
MKQRKSHRVNFPEVLWRAALLKSVDRIQVLLKSDKNSRQSHEGLGTIMTIFVTTVTMVAVNINK